MPEPLIPGQEGYLPPRVPALPVTSPTPGQFIYPVASLVVMLVTCCTLYAMWQNSKSNLQPSVTNFLKTVTNDSDKQNSSVPAKLSAHAKRPAPVVHKAPKTSAEARKTSPAPAPVVAPDLPIIDSAPRLALTSFNPSGE
jgi:hypothetical protein